MSDIDVRGHKVFVFERNGSPWIEMVNDDRPLVRMTIELTPEDAREIADALSDAAVMVAGADLGECFHCGWSRAHCQQQPDKCCDYCVCASVSEEGERMMQLSFMGSEPVRFPRVDTGEPTHVKRDARDARSICGIKNPLPVVLARFVQARFVQAHTEGRGGNFPVCPDCAEEGSEG